MSDAKPGMPDGIDVDAEWDRFSAVIQRLMVRETKRRRAAAESPPGEQEKRAVRSNTAHDDVNMHPSDEAHACSSPV